MMRSGISGAVLALAASSSLASFSVTGVNFGGSFSGADARANVSWIGGSAWVSPEQTDAFAADTSGLAGVNSNYVRGAKAGTFITLGSQDGVDTIGGLNDAFDVDINTAGATDGLIATGFSATGTTLQGAVSTVDPLGISSIDSSDVGVMAEATLARIALSAGSTFDMVNLAVVVDLAAAGPNAEANAVANTVVVTTDLLGSDDNVAIVGGVEVADPLNFSYRLVVREVDTTGFATVSSDITGTDFGSLERVLVYDVVLQQIPAPGSASLLVVATLAATRRRRG